MSDASLSAKLIAFYLPQFHPIMENDRWWGTGFTEWTMLAQSTAQFRGHQQPQIPADLGFYDLRLRETRAAQATLARRYSIDAFCYYHYWFDGRPLLERPLLEMLASGDPDLPFCLCWANENWTRNWDGGDGEVLLTQKASDERDHFVWLSQFLREPRYVRVDGKPIILIYRSSILADAIVTTEQWRVAARRQGIGELYLVRVESRGDEQDDPRGHGFDAALEFQPDWANLPNPVQKPDQSTTLRLLDYAMHAEKQERKPIPLYPRFPCVFPAWDNTPRQRANATIFTDAQPERYERWLRSAIRIAGDSPLPEPIVFINAWNEWAEGAHLEPDTCQGHAFLEATARARRPAVGAPFAGQGPLSHSFLWQQLSDSVDIGAAGQYPLPRIDLIDLFRRPPRMTLDVGCGTGATAAEIKRRYPQSTVFGLEPNATSAAVAARQIDHVIVSKIEDLDLSAHQVFPKTIDTMLVLDVLEHLNDPLAFLRDVRQCLSADAQIIASIPNSRNLWLISEVLNGNFSYEANGLLDITHIRFFSRKQAVQLFVDAGYRVVHISYYDDGRLAALDSNVTSTVTLETPNMIVKDLTREDLQELKALQFHIVAQLA